MKQIIPQSKIDESAKKHSNGYWGENYITECKNYNEAGFNAGVEFTLNEIQPLMVEFAEWISKNNWNSDFADEYGYGFSRYVGEDKLLTFKTTQQLFEEFINYKNKESE